MRKVVVVMGMSVDGFIASPDGGLDWHSVDEELHQYFNDLLRPMGAFLHGRRIYELMADYWPTADQDPDANPIMLEYATIWCEKPKVVYSRTLQHADWNATVVHEVDPEAVRAMKAEPGGDLVLGGAEIAAEFARQGLVDEWRIHVHPTVIGRGQPLFPDPDVWVDLRLIETKVFGNGVVLLHYETVR